MSIELSLTLISILAQITGFSIADLRKLSKSKKDLVNPGVFRLLSIFDKSDDPLTGLWELNTWDMKNQKYVSGKLAILYRNPETEFWKGIMYLKYCRTRNSKGFIAKSRGDITESVYEVEFWEKEISLGAGTLYRGTSTQIYRKPKKEFVYAGEFDDMEIIDGKLSGTFRNTTSPGQANVAFHQRKRWKEIDSTHFFR